MADQPGGPKLHIDSDWKAQAQAEKDRLAQQAKKAEVTGAGRAAGSPPPASFETLVNTMATQALFAMGAIADPRTGQRIAHPDLARHHIDMLGVIEAKTKGNLTEEESKLLASTLYDLRNTYIHLLSAARSSK